MRLLWEHEDEFNTSECFKSQFDNITYPQEPHINGEDEDQYHVRFVDDVLTCTAHKLKNKFPSVTELLMWSVNASALGFTFFTEDQRRFHYNKLKDLKASYQSWQSPKQYTDRFCFAVKAVIRTNTDFKRWQVTLYPKIYRKSQLEMEMNMSH